MPDLRHGLVSCKLWQLYSRHDAYDKIKKTLMMKPGNGKNRLARLPVRKFGLSFILLIFIFWCCAIPVKIQAQNGPVFVIIAYGFWGSMDRLPTSDPAWLASSPYPHYRKHQDADFLTSDAYQPIPQKYLATGEGPSIFKYFLCSYYLLEHEMAYWAQRVNRQYGGNQVKIFDDWQALQAQIGGSGVAGNDPRIGKMNIIYLKYDWRLDLPQIERDYVAPLVTFIDGFWPRSKIHFIGHSLGGLVGRYAVSRHPKRFDSLLSIGGPQYGIYEIALERRGERVAYNGDAKLERSQELGLKVAESFFFGTDVFKQHRSFPQATALFIQRYLPMMRWLDPEAGLLNDGFDNLPKLNEATAHPIAIYGLGYGSYDLSGVYHSEVPDGGNVGSGLAPGRDSPADYQRSGDGRIDPLSAQGPFPKTLCLGKDQPHGSMMWSPLVLGMLIDRYFYGGTMSAAELWWEFRRLQVPSVLKKRYFRWIEQARSAWD